MRYLSAIFCLLATVSCRQTVDRTALVDPLIGSGGHGHVFVGAAVPHGMVQVGPNNVSQGWDWCSGYHDSDPTIAGFAQNHLSGTGIADLGEIVVMPFTGEPRLTPGTGCGDGYAVRFDKRRETVHPGYYAVTLGESGIFAELTATPRVAFHRYNRSGGAEKSPPLCVLLDLETAPRSLARKGCLDSHVRLIDDSTAVGYRCSDEWARGQEVWFALRFSQPARSVSLYSGGETVPLPEAAGTEVKAVFDFGACRRLLLKAALSYTSADAALRNLAEADGMDFDRARDAARTAWKGELARIEFEGIDPLVDTLFYTALYHTALSPQLFADRDNAYRGADGMVRRAVDFTPYTIFSLWDTYRAAHPLATLIDPRAGDYAASLCAIARESGRLAVWHLAGHETDCMVGVHSVPVMADAALKGVEGVDVQEIYALIRRLAEQPVPGMAEATERGFIPADEVNWSVSRALEYCIDFDAVARVAAAAGDSLTAARHAALARSYRRYFDPATGFMRPRLADGSWRTPFDPSFSLHEAADYVEGNAWQYTWLVPHDVEGLISLFGGEERFLDKLDSLFTADSSLNEGASIDITGMIGQYAHGNEPSHHTTYLYTYAGRPWRTAELVRRICRTFYTPHPDGLIGNEDCGQMSAWYVFSALGFYPVHPTAGVYVFGSPLARRAVIHTVSGRTFTVRAENNGPRNIYIRSATLDGEPYPYAWITHERLLRGGELVFEMGDRPDPAFGAAAEVRPGAAEKRNLCILKLSEP